jgi:hypothetical protein
MVFDDVFILIAFPRKPGLYGGKTKPAGNSSGFQKNMSGRSEIPPEQKKMPRPTLQRGNGDHRLGRFNEHLGWMLR